MTDRTPRNEREAWAALWQTIERTSRLDDPRGRLPARLRPAAWRYVAIVVAASLVALGAILALASALGRCTDRLPAPQITDDNPREREGAARSAVARQRRGEAAAGYLPS